MSEKRRFMYVRFEYNPMFVNNHGAAVEMPWRNMEEFVRAQLTQARPIDEMSPTIQFIEHGDVKVTLRVIDNTPDDAA